MVTFIRVKSFDLAPAMSPYVDYQTPSANYGFLWADEETQRIKMQLF